MKCKSCDKQLTGRQTHYCSRKCRNKATNLNHQVYQNQKARGLKRKLDFIMDMGGKCQKCGYDQNLAALSFHHSDPTKKEIKLDMRAMSNHKLHILITEIEKCELLCLNCHAEHHHPSLDKNTMGLTGFEPISLSL